MDSGEELTVSGKGWHQSGLFSSELGRYRSWFSL